MIPPCFRGMWLQLVSEILVLSDFTTTLDRQIKFLSSIALRLKNHDCQKSNSPAKPLIFSQLEEVFDAIDHRFDCVSVCDRDDQDCVASCLMSHMNFRVISRSNR